jgi:hypothetical protein
MELRNKKTQAAMDRVESGAPIRIDEKNLTWVPMLAAARFYASAFITDLPGPKKGLFARVKHYRESTM